MDDGAQALARRAQRFGKAPPAEEVGYVDEEARLTEVGLCLILLTGYSLFCSLFKYELKSGKRPNSRESSLPGRRGWRRPRIWLGYVLGMSSI
jgi:hypothetical protein